MDVEVRGWSRDHGGTAIFSEPLSLIKPSESVDNFEYKKSYISTALNVNGHVDKVFVYGSTDIKLGGHYQVKITLSRSDIFYLAWLALKSSTLDRLVNSFAGFSAKFGADKKNVGKSPAVERVAPSGRFGRLYHFTPRRRANV